MGVSSLIQTRAREFFIHFGDDFLGEADKDVDEVSGISASPIRPRRLPRTPTPLIERAVRTRLSPSLPSLDEKRVVVAAAPLRADSRVSSGKDLPVLFPDLRREELGHFFVVHAFTGGRERGNNRPILSRVGEATRRRAPKDVTSDEDETTGGLLGEVDLNPKGGPNNSRSPDDENSKRCEVFFALFPPPLLVRRSPRRKSNISPAPARRTHIQWLLLEPV